MSKNEVCLILRSSCCFWYCVINVFGLVHGVEYGFGAHEHSTTGIFEVEPKQCPGFTFRKSILIGRTDLDPENVRAFMEKLAEEYSGNTYHLITKNCNHFCNDVCVQLTRRSIPSWVNRLARFGKKLQNRNIGFYSVLVKAHKFRFVFFPFRFVLQLCSAGGAEWDKGEASELKGGEDSGSREEETSE